MCGFLQPDHSENQKPSNIKGAWNLAPKVDLFDKTSAFALQVTKWKIFPGIQNNNNNKIIKNIKQNKHPQ